jgi:hypothetical protein
MCVPLQCGAAIFIEPNTDKQMYDLNIIYSLFTEAACLGDPDERVDCGHPGITEDQCLTNTDCCWDNTIPKKFQCFHKEGKCDVIIFL